MDSIQVDALTTIVHQLPELVEQLKIANQLKAFELKYYRDYKYKFGQTQQNAIEIDNILNKINNQ